MTSPRAVNPGETLFLTKRCHRRQFLLKPSVKLNGALLYLLAVLTSKHGIQLHAVVAMSNHVHYVLTDPGGTIVDFIRELHSLLARYLNCTRGEFESLWSTQQLGKVVCLQADDVVDKIGYTMANPVAAGLVRRAKKWPGVRMAWPQRPVTVRRPKAFFDAKGELPETATLRFHRPPIFLEWSDVRLQGYLATKIAEAEREAVDRVEQSGGGFLGRKRVQKQRHRAYPSKGNVRFGIRPQVASRCKQARMERLRLNKAWLEAYRGARDAWLRGLTAIFPAGTWKMRRLLGVPCHPF